MNIKFQTAAIFWGKNREERKFDYSWRQKVKLIKSSIDKIIVKHCIVIGQGSKKKNKTVTCFKKINMMISIQQTIDLDMLCSNNEVELWCWCELVELKAVYFHWLISDAVEDVIISLIYHFSLAPVDLTSLQILTTADKINLSRKNTEKPHRLPV